MFDSKYFERYATVILNIPHIDEFEKSLPSSKFDGYKETMQKVLSAIHNEIDGFEDLLTQTSDSKDIIFIKKEIEMLRKKEEIVRRAIEKSIEINSEESETIEDQPKKNLIYLKSAAGNVLIESDSKDFPEEGLVDLIELIQRLKNYDVDFNSALHKKLNNNGNYDGIFELKRNKARMAYKHLDKDTVLVINVWYKNETDPTRERDTLATRIKQSQGFVSSLVENLKNPEEKAKIIEENLVVEKDLIEKLTLKSRGRK